MYEYELIRDVGGVDMSQTSPSITITLNKDAVVNKLQPYIFALNHLVELQIDALLNITGLDFDVKGGWLFIKYSGDKYPAVWFKKPVPYIGLLDESEVMHFLSLLYFPRTGFNAYLNFNERFRGEAYETANGMYVANNEIVLYTGGQGPKIASINPGDTVVVDTFYYYDQNAKAWKIGGTVYKFDWEQKSFTKLGVQTGSPKGGNYKWKYWAIIEGNANPYEIGIGYILIYEDGTNDGINGNRIVTIKMLAEKGILKNPADVYPF